MCFCSETEKVHFYLSSEHDAPPVWQIETV